MNPVRAWRRKLTFCSAAGRLRRVRGMWWAQEAWAPASLRPVPRRGARRPQRPGDRGAGGLGSTPPRRPGRPPTALFSARCTPCVPEDVDRQRPRREPAQLRCRRIPPSPRTPRVVPSQARAWRPLSSTPTRAALTLCMRTSPLPRTSTALRGRTVGRGSGGMRNARRRGLRAFRGIGVKTPRHKRLHEGVFDIEPIRRCRAAPALSQRYSSPRSAGLSAIGFRIATT